MKDDLELILRNGAPELEGQRLSRTQQFRLLVYYSYCYYSALLTHATAKKGCLPSIRAGLMVAILLGVTDLFESMSAVLNNMMNKAWVLYEKLDDNLEHIDWEVSPSSQSRTVEAIVTIVFGKKTPVLLQKDNLYNRLWTAHKSFPAFERFFLVEEDSDWQRTSNELRK